MIPVPFLPISQLRVAPIKSICLPLLLPLLPLLPIMTKYHTAWREASPVPRGKYLSHFHILALGPMPLLQPFRGTSESLGACIRSFFFSPKSNSYPRAMRARCIRAQLRATRSNVLGPIARLFRDQGEFLGRKYCSWYFLTQFNESQIFSHGTKCSKVVRRTRRVVYIGRVRG